ncbi:hypothetical protein WOLCODRAFT_19886 [Wolfiporia cocos MD-104 SS10]|uniref:Uncharacterized protein n=1 Tax=Wolfiporia cocos (strain MD-104) TaxID=742152 RepID=A0A2H3JEZ0_WOLCO|nr:hypothetical protein WOLCODRAFT_19886 [Wolfiporia cocos MD-104 SS10]
MAFYMIEVMSSTMFAALRVFAMYERSHWIAASVLLSGAINPFILIYIFIASLPVLSTADRRQACTLSIAGDRYAYEESRIAKVSSGINAKYILFRDTATCFGFLCLVNVIGIATGRQTELFENLQVLGNKR